MHRSEVSTYVGGEVSSCTCLTGLLEGGLSSDSFTCIK